MSRLLQFCSCWHCLIFSPNTTTDSKLCSRLSSKEKEVWSHHTPLLHSTLAANMLYNYLQTEHALPQVHHQFIPQIPVLLPSSLHSFKNSPLLRWRSDSQEPPNQTFTCWSACFHFHWTFKFNLEPTPSDSKINTNHDSFNHQLKTHLLNAGISSNPYPYSPNTAICNSLCVRACMFVFARTCDCVIKFNIMYSFV